METTVVYWGYVGVILGYDPSTWERGGARTIRLGRRSCLEIMVSFCNKRGSTMLGGIRLAGAFVEMDLCP